MTQPLLLGVDTGGTFTDFVLLQAHHSPGEPGSVRIHKVLSTPANPSQAIFQGLEEMGLAKALSDGYLLIVHGSTVATNAALERKGVKTAYVTNEGFGDVLTLARQTRQRLYDLTPPPETPPVPHELCFEVACRRTHDNQILTELTDTRVNDLVARLNEAKPEAVAINLLFSYVDDADEKRLEEALSPYFYVARSSFILPQDGEYERGMTTWLSAWLGPLMQKYLTTLNNRVLPSRLAIMQSSGGTIDANNASRRAANLLLSGPAGGLAAARTIGQMTGISRLLTFDMGGTSTDVALIDGDIRISHQGQIADFPVAAPMVDMHTIGAGGGSIAWKDAGGMLQVGPQSAGASPGPACYGQGGQQVTVTDANVFLGRILPDSFLGGGMPLDQSATAAAVEALAQEINLDPIATAKGVLTVANTHMVEALRKISVHKGVDPRQFTLCCFGGAGGLHVCALSEALEIPSALVPVHSGVLSALGMIVAPKERRLSHSMIKRLDAVTPSDISEIFDALANQARAELIEEGVAPEKITFTREVALRYLGQRYALTLPVDTASPLLDTTIQSLILAFHEAHAQRYGHKMDRPVELATVKLNASVPAHRVSLPMTAPPRAAPAETQPPGSPTVSTQPVQPETVTGADQRQLTDGATAVCLSRDTLPVDCPLVGPLIVTDPVSTVFVHAGWQLRKDEYGNLHLHRLTSTL